MIRIYIITTGILLSGCASVIDGTSQEITFYSNPPQATCNLNRNGKPLQSLVTPATVMVKKTKHHIDVSCEKTGYQPATARLDSKIQDATWGNIILGGGIGWAIDSASGADNKYEKSLTVTLVPIVAGMPASGTAAITAVTGQALPNSSENEQTTSAAPTTETDASAQAGDNPPTTEQDVKPEDRDSQAVTDN